MCVPFIKRSLHFLVRVSSFFSYFYFIHTLVLSFPCGLKFIYFFQERLQQTNITSSTLQNNIKPQTNSEDNLYLPTNNDILLTTVNLQQELPCTTGVRMPNHTDCTKYYVCNSTSHALQVFSCPPQMTFNPLKRTCEANVSVWCNHQSDSVSQLPLTLLHTTTKATTEHEIKECNKPGRIHDPESKQHYYYCFNLFGKLTLQRLSCPTGLFYCPLLRICEKESKCPIYSNYSNLYQ